MKDLLLRFAFGVVHTLLMAIIFAWPYSFIWNLACEAPSFNHPEMTPSHWFAVIFLMSLYDNIPSKEKWEGVWR